MMPRLLLALLLLTAAAPITSCRGPVPDQERITARSVQSAAAQLPVVDSSFVRLIEELSEPAGYFDTDNLISNERSYLHVLGAIRRQDVRGGAYIGVGPDQNFSYIAEVRPEIAFIIDIRRDNLLQHLWFKALFELADNRVEYLSIMFGKRTPKRGRWEQATIEELVEYIDATASRPEIIEANRDVVKKTVQSFGLALSEEDLHTIERIHASFFGSGLDLRFTSHRRPPRAYYPRYRELLLESDLTDQKSNYLATERRFRVVKSLQEGNRIVPVVGDLAGPHALRAIGRYLAAQEQTVSAIYTSNVEFYLMRNGTFDSFANNVQYLPHNARSLIIRSYFGGWYRRQHPQAVAGYFSSQLLQHVQSFLAAQGEGGYVSYFDLVTRNALDLR
jgi:hypothetical protein